MRKYVIIAIILSIINLILYKYLISINLSKKAYEFKEENTYFIYQTNDIELKDTKNFDINKYININSFNHINYKYEFNEKFLNVYIEDNKYSFSYSILKPEVIEKYVYIESQNETNIDRNNIDFNESNEETKIYNNQIFDEEDYLHVYNKILNYDLDTDLNQIRQELINNIETNLQVSIDYSQLNVSSIGQYSVFYITNNEKIEIIVQIS